MVDFTDRDSVKNLKANMHVCFDTPPGKEVMDFLERICNWYPSAGDPVETNEVIGRDARRQALATIKTILKCSPEQLMKLNEG